MCTSYIVREKLALYIEEIDNCILKKNSKYLGFSNKILIDKFLRLMSKSCLKSVIDWSAFGLGVSYRKINVLDYCNCFSIFGQFLGFSQFSVKIIALFAQAH